MSRSEVLVQKVNSFAANASPEDPAPSRPESRH